MSDVLDDVVDVGLWRLRCGSLARDVRALALACACSALPVACVVADVRVASVARLAQSLSPLLCGDAACVGAVCLSAVAGPAEVP